MEMDVDPQTVERPVLGYGFKPHVPHGLLYFRHTPTMVAHLTNPELTYGYYIFVGTDAEERSGYQPVVRFLWSTFGQAHMTDVLPQTLSFDRFVERGMDYAFRLQGPGLPLRNAGGMECSLPGISHLRRVRCGDRPCPLERCPNGSDWYAPPGLL